MMSDEEKIRILLHRAILELNAIHTMATEVVPDEYRTLIHSSHGEDVVESGMRLLGLKDLSDDSPYGVQV